MSILLARGSSPGFTGAIQFVQNVSQDYDNGRIAVIPEGFGDAEFTFKIVIQPSQITTIGSTATLPGMRENWSTETGEPGGGGSWWFRGNFLIDGFNNTGDFGDGSFALQVYNSGYMRWTFGDGSTNVPAGGVWGMQNSSGTNILDGSRHVIHCTRTWQSSPTDSADLRLYVDGVQQGATINSDLRTNMATTYWDDWTGYPAAQQFWTVGAEKQSVVGVVNDYEDYKGDILEIAFYDGALSTTDIANDQGVALTGHGNYLAHFAFNEGLGNPQTTGVLSDMVFYNQQPNGFWPGADVIGSIEYDGTVDVTYDRVNVPINGGEAANVGDTDFSIDCWIRPTSENDNTGTAAVQSNIFIDRDNFTGGSSGAYILGIVSDNLVIGINEDLGGYTDGVGSSTINDGNWHYILFSYDRSTGDFNGYVDGAREIDTTTGNPDDLSWISGGNTEDQRLVFGTEKHFQGDFGFYGHMSEIRIRDIYIDTATIEVPTAPIGIDADTICWWPHDDQSGTILREVIDSGNSDGTVVFNGGSTIPVWDTINPY